MSIERLRKVVIVVISIAAFVGLLYLIGKLIAIYISPDACVTSGLAVGDPITPFYNSCNPFIRVLLTLAYGFVVFQLFILLVILVEKMYDKRS